MAKTHLKLVTPAIKKRAVTPRRQPNSELRSREHLTEAEVDKLIEAAKGNRYGHRDATMILVAYRHGLRALEVCDLRWEQIDWNSATLHVRRVKSGKPSTHPIRGDELRALRKLQRIEHGVDWMDCIAGRMQFYVFLIPDANNSGQSLSANSV